MIAAGANDLFVSVLDASLTEYLIPIFPARKGGIKVVGEFGDLSQAQTSMPLFFLEIQEVTEVRFGEKLEIFTNNYDRYFWYLHPPKGSHDETLQSPTDAGVQRHHEQA